MSKTVCFITRNFGKYDPDSLRGYESIGGFRALRKALTMEGYAIADVLAANGVQGRGGAAYDMGKKWRQARDVPGAHKCVVCNADEGEPGTFKDRELLTHDPFQLLEGMIIAGWAVGADNGYIYLREEYSHLRPRLLSAIAQAKAASAGIMMVGKRPEEAGKGIIFTVMVETYAVLALLFSFLMVNGVQL